MTLIKQCKYDNILLEAGKVVVFNDEEGPKLGVVKTSYHDSNTDCSWHYIKTGPKSEVDIPGGEIIYILEGEDAELLKAYILKGEILEDKNIKRAELLSDLEYYKGEIAEAERKLKFSKEKLEETQKLLDE